jgi:hypothetical protein
VDVVEPDASRPTRVPGALTGQIWIAPDFDEFTAHDEADWYGDDQNPLRA